ncbi:hypothetical protein ACSMXN_23235 [Jatrophihabitans sp. DSM 45814]
MNRLLAAMKRPVVRYFELMATADPLGMAISPLDAGVYYADPMLTGRILTALDTSPAESSPAAVSPTERPVALAA